jgi:maltose alpha-D-glucosyltransferase/alpha-amylase
MRSNQDNWYQNAIFYEVNTRSFYDSNGDGQGDLLGVREKLDYLKGLGVDCLWLLPVYASPMKDGGYDISDFRAIHPDFGTLDDLKELVVAAHTKGLRVIMDLVLNHTSDQHEWFQKARADRHSPYRDYYVWRDDEQGYRDARIIFLDTEKSNWSWDEKAGQYYWHRFYSFQPDLNYDNPRVVEEMIGVMDFWLALGIDGFRVDAVPYLIEREGTNCENLPETHAVLKKMRAFVDKRYPGRVLLCEANQWPHDVRAYFGDGDEFQMAFHFPLMPRMYMALKQGDYAPIRWALENTPQIPGNCQWCTFLRNHDELTLEMVTEKERQWMWQQYAPEPGMRLNLGIRRRLAPLLDNDPKQIALAYALLFALPGSNVLYYGDEIGMGDDIQRPDRDGVRSPMQWNASKNAGFSSADTLFAPVLSGDFAPVRVNVAAQQAAPHSLFNQVRKMIAVRKAHPAFAHGKYTEVASPSATIAAFLRTDENERILAVHNLGWEEQTFEFSQEQAQRGLEDLLTGERYAAVQGKYSVKLAGKSFCWLKIL